MKFDAILREAELKLLDVATDSLRVDVEVHRQEIQERQKDIDGTIAQWKTQLSKVKEVTSSQVDNLIEAAAAFVVKLSSDSAITRASKSLQAEITPKESKGREMEINEPSIPEEQSIRKLPARRSTVKESNQLVAFVKERSLSQTILEGKVGRSNKSKSHIDRIRPNRRRVDRKDKTSVHNSRVDPSHQSCHI